MSYRDELIKFLSKSENLALAVEIADHVPEVKNRLRLKLWTSVHEQVRDRLVAAQAIGKFPGWTVDWEADCLVALRPPGWSKGTGRVSPVLEKAGDFIDVGIYHGGVHADGSGETSEALERLSAAIRQQGYTSANATWLGWSRAEKRGLNTSAVLEQIATDDRLAVEYADILWKLFESNAEALDEVNHLVSGPRPT